MGCCECKKWLKLLAGIVFILGSLKLYLAFDPWLVLGAYFVLCGLMPMVCKCEMCDVKKKK